MDVVKNQMSIPTYEKPMMEVMELEVEGMLAESFGTTNGQINVGPDVVDGTGTGDNGGISRGWDF